MTARRYIKPMAIAAVLFGAGVIGYWTLYEQPRQERVADLDLQLQQNEDLQRLLRNQVQVRQDLREAGSTTLGSSADQVHARFRAGLQRITGRTELTNVRIDTRDPRGMPSPILASGRRITGMPSLRGQIDFSVIRGEVTATGSLEQVLRTVALAEAQPWVHRVERFSIRPEGRDREKFSLSLSVSTMLMPPALAPRESGDPVIVELDGDAPTAWASLVERNPFREPPPPPRVAERQRPPRQAAPAPPYNEWRLTGVVESRIGTEAFLVNTRSDERMAIGAGSSVAGARLVAAEGERAIFEIDGEEYEVFNGQTLEQRRPTNR